MGETSNFPKSLTLGIVILEFPESLYIGQDKHDCKRKFCNIFLFINLTCFGCWKELSHCDSSFVYPQHMFWLRNKKIIFIAHS